MNLDGGALIFNLARNPNRGFLLVKFTKPD
jgi:hypothetical protein